MTPSSSRRYVSRAAVKLASALDRLKAEARSEAEAEARSEAETAAERGALSIRDRICLDLGAAHGGFTQVLLERNARRVYAVDVGYGLLDYHLRNDQRVIPLERHDLRYLSMDWFLEEDRALLRDRSLSAPPPCRLFISSDVSFLSSTAILQSLARFYRQEQVAFEALILIKPQFEASQKTQGGVIRDEKMRQEIVAAAARRASSYGLLVERIIPAAITGRKGNLEYIMYARAAPQ